MFAQQICYSLGPIPTPPSRLPHLNRKEREINPMASYLAQSLLLIFFPSLKSSHTLINSPAWHFLQHRFPHSSRPNLPNRGGKSYFLCLMLCGQHVCLPCGPRLHCSLPTDCCLHRVTAWPHQSLVATVPVASRGLEFCIPKDKLQE